MKTFTLKEVSKKINVSPGTLRQWEKDLNGFLVVPRTKQGARIYTDSEIDILKNIKHMYGNKISKELICRSLQNKMTPITMKQANVTDSSLTIVTDRISPLPIDEPAVMNTEPIFEAIAAYKQTVINEIKEEIRTVLRKEVVDEVKKEISKGTFLTVKSLSDSIYKSNAITKEVTAEITSLSKQLSESTGEISHFIETTNTEIINLTERIEKEREQFQHVIRQREVAFQNMLLGFRDAATAKEKRWWQFWKSN